MKTWQYEMFVVAVVLSAVVLITKGGYLEWIGAGAVLLSFGHAQVADRLAWAASFTAESFSPDARRYHVRCYAWATRYLVGKEALWLVYFVLHQSWSALAGVGLFLAYPFWRAWWRS